jgi:hypothetical protein
MWCNNRMVRCVTCCKETIRIPLNKHRKHRHWVTQLLRHCSWRSHACGRDDSEAGALPTVGFGPTVRREAAVKCMADWLQCSSLYRPLLVRAGLRQALPLPNLYIVLQPSRWQGTPSRMCADPVAGPCLPCKHRRAINFQID